MRLLWTNILDKTCSDSTWEKLTNGEVIEYHPSFCFGRRLSLFPAELRKRLDQQRKEYKQNKGKRTGGKANPQSPTRRKIKKARKEVRELAKLVELTQQ